MQINEEHQKELLQLANRIEAIALTVKSGDKARFIHFLVYGLRKIVREDQLEP